MLHPRNQIFKAGGAGQPHRPTLRCPVRRNLLRGSSSHAAAAPPATTTAAAAAAAAASEHRHRRAFEGLSSGRSAEDRKSSASFRERYQDLKRFESALHYTFQYAELGSNCCFHGSSLVGGGGQKLLARLGIEVWATICVAHLAAVYPKADAAAVATLAQAMSTTEAIQAEAQRMGVESFLIFQPSPGLQQPNGKMMKDFFYAILAAVFLDAGLDAAYAAFSGRLESVRQRMPEHLTQRCLQDASQDPLAPRAPEAPQQPPETVSPRSQILRGFTSLFGSADKKVDASPGPAAAVKPIVGGAATKPEPPVTAPSGSERRAAAAEGPPANAGAVEAEARSRKDALLEWSKTIVLAAAPLDHSTAQVQQAARDSRATKAWARLLPLRDLLAANLCQSLLPPSGGSKSAAQPQALSRSLTDAVEMACSPSPAASLRQSVGLRALVGRYLWTLALATERMQASQDPVLDACYLNPQYDERFPRKARADRAWEMLDLGALTAAASGPLLGDLPQAAAGAGGAAEHVHLAAWAEDKVSMVTISRLTQVFEAGLGAICLDSRDNEFEFELAGQACSCLMSAHVVGGEQGQ